ncbi:MAG: oxidase [Deltaproteobacteria bacterium]|nr:MAG: oxidase [Deltaproteobacteria bacterium]
MAHDPYGEHVSSLGALVGTWLALLALTVTTVAVARVDLGSLNVVAALGIASVKAAIVALVFMHLKHGGRFLRVVFTVSVAFAVLFIGLVLFDTKQYEPDVAAYRAARAAAVGGEAPAAPARKASGTAPAR